MSIVHNMESIIAERAFDSPMTEGEDFGVIEEMAACLNLYNVQFVESFVSDQRTRAFCHFIAPDAESVRRLLRGAGIEADSVWRCERRSLGVAK